MPLMLNTALENTTSMPPEVALIDPDRGAVAVTEPVGPGVSCITVNTKDVEPTTTVPGGAVITKLPRSTFENGVLFGHNGQGLATRPLKVSVSPDTVIVLVPATPPTPPAPAIGATVTPPPIAPPVTKCTGSALIEAGAIMPKTTAATAAIVRRTSKVFIDTYSL